MLISIVTLNYNKKDLTLACIASLNALYKKELEGDIMEVIIVDNASADDSVKVMKEEVEKKKYKNIKVFANSGNDGFGKGCNVGAAKTTGKYIVFLNNDTIVKDEGIMRMAQYLDEHEDVAILGGQLKNTDGSLQVSVGSFYNLFRILLLLFGGQRFGLIDKSPARISKVDWVKGGLLMIRREVFDAIKGFDEKIFMYTEDMELCYRAMLKGYKTYFYPNVDVIHAEHGSTNRAFAIVNIYKNLQYFYKKHKSRAEYQFVKAVLKAKAMVLITVGSLTRSEYLVKTYKEALQTT